MTETRTAIIFSFNTHLGRVRTLNVPEPLPLPVLDIENVGTAAEKIILADIFDEDEFISSGRLVSLQRAVHEHVDSTPWF